MAQVTERVPYHSPITTPAMIEAARTILHEYDPGWSNDDETLARIFDAMWAASPAIMRIGWRDDGDRNARSI